MDNDGSFKAFEKWYNKSRPSLFQPNLPPLAPPSGAATVPRLFTFSTKNKTRQKKTKFDFNCLPARAAPKPVPPPPPPPLLAKSKDEWPFLPPPRHEPKHYTHPLYPGLKEGSKNPFLPVMADPFEVRMRFTSQLQHLNASVTSSQKAAHYALKYRDMDEDLHSCILEQLERNSMNNRANIMFFIEHLCDMAQKENHDEFIRMMQRDILRVVDAVAPEDGSGAANIKVVRRVLSGLQQKGILTPEGLAEIEACLKERDTLPTHSAVGSPQANAKAVTTTPRGTKVMDIPKPEKRQIEQRIEEDRERHKRLRENIWAVNAEDNAEYAKILDELSDIGEDDFLAAEEEAVERRTAAKEFARIGR